MRKSYIEKELLLELEERNEQLQAEKERLMYDNALQRRGRPIEEDDDRSAISRGLLAGPASVGIGDTSLGPAGAALLPCTAPKSEHDPDLEAAAANLSMHRVTGAFEDPAHEAAFAAQLFRQAYPGHVLIMAVMMAHLIGIALDPPAPRAASSMVALWGAVTLLGRVLLHQHVQDQERAQRIGSRSWTAMMVMFFVFLVGPLLVSLDFACKTMGMDLACVNDHGKTHGQGEYIVPFLAVANAVVNGSHGMSFAHKTALIVFLPVRGLLVMVICNDYFILELSGIGILILCYAIAHTVEIHLRRSYADKLRTDQLLRDEEKSVKRRLEAMDQLQAENERLEGSIDKKNRRLEERNEQLLAEKERLLYDMQQRFHPIDDDNRSAIRRGLQAGAGKPHQPSDNTSEAGGPVPLVSPPPSLPPGPPSSVSSGCTAYTATRAEAGRQRLESSSEALAAPTSTPSAPGASSGTETEQELVADALLTEVLGDEETLLELQTMLNSTEEEPTAQEPNQGGAQTNARVVEGTAQQRMMAYPMQDTVTEVVDSTPQGSQADKRQRQASYHLPVHGLPVNGFGWHPSVHVELPRSFGGSAGGSCPPTPTSLHAVQTDNMTPRQQALHVARHRIQAARVDVEVCQVVRTLAVALGASRTESGTIKALQAVLLQLERPGMSCDEARASTGASRSNTSKWLRRVRHAQLDLAPPKWK